MGEQSVVGIVEAERLALQDAQDVHRFTLYERWREPSVDAFVKNQAAKSYRKAYEDKLPALLQSPRTVSVLQYVNEWHRK
jgi:quinol monooxygenase YgiN